jgi:hypothetical protein
MRRSINWIVLLLVSGSVFIGCSPKAKYDKMVKKELASGLRNDSLVLGLYFGMPEKEFYTHCWNLNHKGVIKQGENNTTVLYELKNELKYQAAMDFYPKFNQGKISELPIRFFYRAWAPWNKNLSADNLQTEVRKYIEKNFGSGFIEVKHSKRGSAFVKVNGNRRITIFKEDEVHVWAVFTDMTIKSTWNTPPSFQTSKSDPSTKDQK